MVTPNIFSTIDCASGFLQIPVRLEDRPKTTFRAVHDHYEYKRMPMELKCGPSTSQRLMSTVLSGMQGLKCLVYLDDIIICGENLEVYNERLRDVFARLRSYNLKLQPDKCEFLRKEVLYLGHRLTFKGLLPDESKLSAAKEFPVPNTTKKKPKGFLGLTDYYRRFIQNVSNISKSLTNLLKNNTPFIWNADTDETFNTLKRLLTSQPLLQYPDFSKPFILTTDASNDALGAILSQGEIGRDLSVAYGSRTFSKAEKTTQL